MTTETKPSECSLCDNIGHAGGDVYEFGFVCNECLDKAENRTGYCSMYCQLTGECDGSC